MLPSPAPWHPMHELQILTLTPASLRGFRSSVQPSRMMRHLGGQNILS